MPAPSPPTHGSNHDVSTSSINEENNRQARRVAPAAGVQRASTMSAKSRAPSKSQRQVSDVEYSSMSGEGGLDSDQQGARPSGEPGTAGMRRQGPSKRPARPAGAKSLDQGNPRVPPLQQPGAANARQQAPVRAVGGTPRQQQQRGKELQETCYLSRSTAPAVGAAAATTASPANQGREAGIAGKEASKTIRQQRDGASASQQPDSLMAAADEDDLNNSMLVETADDEELVADNSGPGSFSGACLPSSLTAGLTKNLIWAVFASTVGSSFQHGYNGGVVNAPERLIGEFVNATYYKRHGELATETQIDFIIALIVSIFCVGGCLGALATAFVADRMGRKEGLIYNNIIVLVAAPMMASSKAAASYELLIVGRFLIGINAGLNAGLAPLYLNEIAPIKLRGALGTIYQLVITISILLSNIFGLPSLLGDAASWPILFVIPIIPAAFMLIALPHCCESPKHLILNQGRELQAQQALAWLRETGDVMEEMDELRAERELNALQQRSISLHDMVSDTCLRRPLTIAIVIMLSQQFSGINAVLFYSTSIFRDAGLSEHAAVRATLGMGIVNVGMTLVSLFLVDRAGRRTLHMTGLMGMAATCLVLAFCLNGTGNGAAAADGDGQATASSGLAVVAVYVFIAMFASGPGAIPWFLVAELFPSNARPLASSIAVAVNWLANFTVSLCFLPLTNVLHGFTFILFAIMLVTFYLFTYYKVPETKGATAEEISALFRR